MKKFANCRGASVLLKDSSQEANITTKETCRSAAAIPKNTIRQDATVNFDASFTISRFRSSRLVTWLQQCQYGLRNLPEQEPHDQPKTCRSHVDNRSHG